MGRGENSEAMARQRGHLPSRGSLIARHREGREGHKTNESRRMAAAVAELAACWSQFEEAFKGDELGLYIELDRQIKGLPDLLEPGEQPRDMLTRVLRAQRAELAEHGGGHRSPSLHALEAMLARLDAGALGQYGQFDPS